jgi:hypothetical protein
MKKLMQDLIDAPMGGVSICFMIWVSLLLAFVGITQAETAQQLLSDCKPIVEKSNLKGNNISFPTTYSTGICWGAFSSIQEAVRYANPNEMPHFGVCAPESSTRSQMIMIFVKYAKEHPEQLHEDFFKVAMESLRNAFPCSLIK